MALLGSNQAYSAKLGASQPSDSASNTLPRQNCPAGKYTPPVSGEDYSKWYDRFSFCINGSQYEKAVNDSATQVGVLPEVTKLDSDGFRMRFYCEYRVLMSYTFLGQSSIGAAELLYPISLKNFVKHMQISAETTADSLQIQLINLNLKNPEVVLRLFRKMVPVVDPAYKQIDFYIQEKCPELP